MQQQGHQTHIVRIRANVTAKPAIAYKTQGLKSQLAHLLHSSNIGNLQSDDTLQLSIKGQTF